MTSRSPGDAGWPLAIGALLLVAALAVLTLSLVPAGATHDPVAFDETIGVGIPAEDAFDAHDRGAVVPKGQGHFTDVEEVVGFRGVEHLVGTLDDPAAETRLGEPRSVYVTDTGAQNVTVAEDGLLEADDPGTEEWVDATRASYVVNSTARTPAGETIVPFASERAAEDFAGDHGGTVLSWAELQDHEVDRHDAIAVRDRVESHHEAADQRVELARELHDRPVEVVVGEDAETIQAAVDTAPEGATVLVPAGTYEETVVVNRSITIAGEPGATIDGGGAGTVIDVRADEVAIDGLAIEGVGDATRADSDDLGHGEDDSDADATDSTPDDPAAAGWEWPHEQGYGAPDAGIAASEVDRLHVTNVTVETGTTGILLRDVDGAVVEGATVTGAEEWRDGFMGILLFRSGAVVQDSAVEGGKDGVYAHRSPGAVIRSSTFDDNRFGIHLMFTSDALIADNAIRGADQGGITMMTDSARNAVVGNDVRNSNRGIAPAGARSYVGGNVFANNRQGMSVATHASLYADNLLYGNDVGAGATSALPSNVVTGNDFVDNDRHVEATAGSPRMWTADGVGNYWSGADLGADEGVTADGGDVDTEEDEGEDTGADTDSDAEGTDAEETDDGTDGDLAGPSEPHTVDTRYAPDEAGNLSVAGVPFSPTHDDPDAVHTDPPGATHEEAPAVWLLDRLGLGPGTAAGSGVVDVAPLLEPVDPERLEAIRSGTNGTGTEAGP